MANMLSMHAQEGSTYILKVEFFAKTSDGTQPSPIVPNSGLSWTLRNENGEIVNNRNGVPLTPGESAYVVLTGNDLSLSGNYPEKRYVTIEGTFNSEIGTNLPLVDEVVFRVDNLVGKDPV